jgi:hypothetical protein
MKLKELIRKFNHKLYSIKTAVLFIKLSMAFNFCSLIAGSFIKVDNILPVKYTTALQTWSIGFLTLALLLLIYVLPYPSEKKRKKKDADEKEGQ